MNNLAQPATILGHNKAIDAYAGYVDKVLADVEQKKQLEALKKQGIDAALLPPDVDLEGTYRVQTDEIVGKMNNLLNTKVDLITAGVDVSSPEYAGKIQSVENIIKGEVVKSKQQKELDNSTLKKLSDAKADSFYDIEKSTQRLADFRSAASKGVAAGDEWIKQNGSILVPKAFDPYKFGADVAETYKTTVTASDPKKVGGQYVVTTTEDVTPENRLGAGEQLYTNPQMKIETDFYYDALSPQAKAEYEQQAITAGGGQGDGVKMFAAQKWADPHWTEKTTKKATNIPQGKGSSKKVVPTDSNTIIDQTMAALNGDESVFRTEPSGLTVLPVLEGMAIGTFEQNSPTPMDDGKGGIVYEDNFKTAPVLVEKVFKDKKGDLYYTTNESKANKRGKTVEGVSFSLPFTPEIAQAIMAKAAVSAGDMTMKDADAYMDKFKENGILKVAKKGIGVGSGAYGDGLKGTTEENTTTKKVYKGLDEQGNPIFE